jgi:CheY-like chemotaxis protein
MSTAKKTILLVDDDLDDLEKLEAELAAKAYRVITARGEAEARQIVGGTRPDLAIVDLMMEKADSGFSLCYHIKKTDPELPIIMLTGVESETGIDFDVRTEDERAWIKADALLDKPVRFEHLEAEIDRLLHAPRSAEGS